MRPINNSVISPTSDRCQETPSTCVTWDGPDIICLGIEICKGQSINPILFEIFKKLCIALEKIDISGVNTACLFALEQEPDNISDLLNAIITEICDDNIRLVALENVPEIAYSAVLPYCLRTVNDVVTVTKIPIDQYFNKVSLTICEELDDLTDITADLVAIDLELVDLTDAIEAACEPIGDVEVNSLLPSCTPPGVSTPINKAYENLEKAFCSYLSFTGSTTDLRNAAALTCPNLNNLPRLSNTGLMSSIYGWIPTPVNAAESVNNLWLTICDIRSAIRNILNNCCADSPCLSFNVFYELQFDTSNPPQYMDIIFNDGVYPPPSPIPGLYGPQTTIKNLLRTLTYNGSGAVPAWVATDFPVIGNVILTINDGSGDIVIDTGHTIVEFMEFPGTLNGKYRFNYTPDYDYNAPIKSLKIEFDYQWNTTPCTGCECCCTYSIINGIY